MNKIYEDLRKKYGNHSEVAKKLGVSVRQYRILRNGGSQKASQRLKIAVQLLHKNIAKNT